jgi:AcrR family transcriptional regulator
VKASTLAVIKTKQAKTKQVKKGVAEKKVLARKRATKDATKPAPKPTTKSTTARGRGRPPIGENGLLDRKMIISCAFQMAREIPLQELSIVRVARELGVTPALIHYYLDGRDALTSGVMNSFYREMLQDWPQKTGVWRDDVAAVVHWVYGAHVEYPGIAAYVVAHNRFRLKQLLVEGETDHGLLLFERMVAAVRDGGFDAYRTAMWSHLLLEFIISMAFAAVRHRFPGEHGEHLDRIFAALDPKQFPNMGFMRKDYLRLNAGELFGEALRLMLASIEMERPGQPTSSTPTRVHKKVV